MENFAPLEWSEPMDLKKKKKVLLNQLVVTLAVVISFVVNSYTREIQPQFIKVSVGMIKYILMQANLYDATPHYSPKGFDGERDVEYTINETFRKQVVNIN